MLSSFTKKLQEVNNSGELGDWHEKSDVLADFKSKDNQVNVDTVLKEVIYMLKFFTDKLEETQSNSSSSLKQAIPVLLEGVLAVLTHSKKFLGVQNEFIELLWKHLCPSLISLLGTPKCERSIVTQRPNVDEMGRGSGCSTSGPNLASTTTKVIYNIAIQLVRLVGPIGSLRPVLESLFHRMLLYPPPQHRHDALKGMKVLLSSPRGVLDIAAPTGIEPGSTKKQSNCKSDMALMKLIVDGIQECCHCNDSAVCITSVECITLLLRTLEKLCRGVGIPDEVVREINRKYKSMSMADEYKNLHSGEQNVNSGFVTEVDNCENAEDSAVDNPEPESSLKAEDVKNSNLPDEGASDIDKEEDTCSNSSVVSSEYVMDVSPTKTLDGTTHPSEEDEDQNTKTNVTVTPSRAFLSEKCDAAERANAQEFINRLSKLLPRLFNLMSICQMDNTLQEFASKFCSDMVTGFPSLNSEPVVIVNADGIYVATITVLSFNLKLIVNGYYNSNFQGKVIESKETFVDNILNSGLLIFLSPSWLNEVYQQVMSRNLLGEAGYEIDDESPLISMLTDIDGLGSHELCGQILTEARSSCDTLLSDDEEDEDDQDQLTGEKLRPNKNSIAAGKKISKQILSTCWEGVLDVLSVLLNGKSSCGITSSLALMLGTEGAKEETMKAREAVCHSLDGLQKAAKLCCILGLQKRCAAVFTQLASTSCVIEERSTIPERKGIKAPILPNRPKLVRLHAAHVLSMDVVMSVGLEMGSHAADCWKHIFRCCSHIARLEHTYFSAGNNQSSLPKVHHEQPVMSIPNLDGSYNCDPEMYMTPMVPVMPVAPTISVHELTRLSSVEAGWDSAISGGGVLSASQASKALCGLSQEVDRLFEDAAQKLNMQALVSFLSELCTASHLQLIQMNSKSEEEEMLNIGSKLPTNALLLYRLQEVLMKVLHTGRPLLHLVQAYNAVSTHLVEASGNPDRRISKMAVTCMHDYITAVLSTHPEYPHFYVNELLCKGFESLFSQDMCDGDVQDQVVCSICELVEACTAEIRSGWRPLFAALQAVKIEYTLNEEVNEARQRHIAAVLDVFEVFLNTDNILVFANAAVDCILCLLKYVRGPDSGSDFTSTDGTENLCLPALNYLRQCCQILASMWKMPQCPIFHGAHRIQVGFLQEIVDPNIPNMDFELFKQNFSSISEHPPKQLSRNPSFSQSFVLDSALDTVTSSTLSGVAADGGTPTDNNSITSQDSGLDVPATTPVVEKACLPEEIKQEHEMEQYKTPTLNALDNQCGLLHVWFLILDGLASATSVCPRNYQPQTMDMLFELLKDTADIPGPSFTMYCVNNLLLPTLQTWLRRSFRNQTFCDTGSANFKQCCGLSTDLVVQLITRFAEETEHHQMMELMLRELFIVLIECVAQPAESISRLGCSCIRHVALAAGPSFTESMWQITVDSFEKAMNVTTYSIRQIMILFHPNSENFYGDIGQVKVATRKDCSPMELERLYQLAQQVFLLDSQIQSKGPNLTTNRFSAEADKSYIFLLYPPNHENNHNPDNLLTRVPFRNLVVGLLSHQLLLQTMGCVLLQTPSIPEAEDSCNSSAPNTDNQEDIPSRLPGMLPYLSTRNIAKILDCLYVSYQIACDFDSRPGLKFLIQKVAQTSVAANLYKQAGASMVFYIHTLIEISSNINTLKLEGIRQSLKQVSTSSMNDQQTCIQHASTMMSSITDNMDIFLFLLQNICDELCQTYVDMTLDEETTTCVDRLSEQPLVFLIAQADDLCDITGSNGTESKQLSSTSSQENNNIYPTSAPVNLHKLFFKILTKSSFLFFFSLFSLFSFLFFFFSILFSFLFFLYSLFFPLFSIFFFPLFLFLFFPFFFILFFPLFLYSLFFSLFSLFSFLSSFFSILFSFLFFLYSLFFPLFSLFSFLFFFFSILFSFLFFLYSLFFPLFSLFSFLFSFFSILFSFLFFLYSLFFSLFSLFSFLFFSILFSFLFFLFSFLFFLYSLFFSLFSLFSFLSSFSLFSFLSSFFSIFFSFFSLFSFLFFFFSILFSFLFFLYSLFFSLFSLFSFLSSFFSILFFFPLFLYSFFFPLFLFSFLFFLFFFFFFFFFFFSILFSFLFFLYSLFFSLFSLFSFLFSMHNMVVQTDDVAPTDDNESVAGTITNPKEDYSINPSDLKSKKEKRAEKESRVYTVATDKLIKNLMTEYKKRKQQHSMPTFVKAGKVPNNKANTAQVFKQREPVDYEIEKQQKVSIMKDSEAHLKSWTELLCAILRLFQELPDSKFYALLPTVFNCINQLVCHSHEQRLNDALAQWLHRVGHMVGINPL
ncbi:unnamed protein product [Acanthosepion pharaonis]|uniref:Mon2/Sec7/BIG1-like HDS domain-containing protein n=1 Tax=Acanthosepion pharaonis TaxID=158019 RepID=A0A812AJV0_ACAPH|nr:unnamed protein product [Sepia pharaonis]